jgi:hypothetical protein
VVRDTPARRATSLLVGGDFKELGMATYRS